MRRAQDPLREMLPALKGRTSCIVPRSSGPTETRQDMPAALLRRSLGCAFVLAILSACFSSHARRFEISSVESDYSPAGRFWVRIGVGDSTVHVEIDSAIAVVPGPRQTSPVAAVSNVMLRALIVTSGVPKWTPLEITDAIRVADTLYWGAPRTLRTLKFDVRRPGGVALDRSWLIFEFTGRALLFNNAPRVQTFACSSLSLAGKPLAQRSSGPAARAEYMKTC